MTKYVNEKIIKTCYECPLRKSSQDGMYCGHPFFDDKKNNPTGWDSMIITQDNMYYGVPNLCPLLLDSVEVVIRLKLIKKHNTENEENNH